ncbi:glycine zipper 2TM domain-containing protein [Pyruvatibacter mobilis]|uniref:glycine zipper 2TM domain-containing protein n=1 Tax=Pyruvatibacter mobilis TaxID=1712261 RepID=UPI003C7BE5D5
MLAFAKPILTVAAAAMAAVFLLAATPTTARAESDCSNTNTGGVLGGIAGAALGGFLGSQFGSGGGKTAATIGGVILGGIAGNQLGKELTCEDEEYVEDTTYESLETGEETTWRNEESGNYGEVRPGEIYTDARGYECRAFEQEIYVNGQPVKDTGTACKQPDGSWQIVS